MTFTRNKALDLGANRVESEESADKKLCLDQLESSSHYNCINIHEIMHEAMRSSKHKFPQADPSTPNARKKMRGTINSASHSLKSIGHCGVANFY